MSHRPYETYMLITDLDGTLIPRGGVVSEANRAAIRSFVAGGGCFGIATGRTPEAAAGYVEGLPINAPCVFFNGSMLYDWGKQQVLATRPLPPAAGGDKTIWPRFARTCLEQFREACIEVYTADNCHIISPAAYDDPRLAHEYYQYEHCAIDKLADIDQTPWLKFFVNAEPAVLRQLEQLAVGFGITELADSFYSEVNYYEFVAKGASKGAMLEEVRKLPAYEQLSIIAAGDYLNDNAMLHLADIGVASGNAHALTKAAADRVGCDAQEHLMAWIMKNVVAC